MDFLQYIFVLLNEALVCFSSAILTYGADLSISLLWTGIAFATFNFFFHAFDLTTPLSGFVNRKLKRGKYLNQGALGGVLRKFHKMKMLGQLGALLVECEDNNGDEICFIPSRVEFQNHVGIKFNWDYKEQLFHPSPRKAREARRNFVGKENWDKFKDVYTPAGRKYIYKLAVKL